MSFVFCICFFRVIHLLEAGSTAPFLSLSLPERLSRAGEWVRFEIGSNACRGKVGVRKLCMDRRICEDSVDHNNNNKDNLWDLFRLPSAPRINSVPHPAHSAAAADIHHYLHYHHSPLYSMDGGGDYHVHAEAHQLHQLHVTNIGAQVAGMRGTSDGMMSNQVLLDGADNNNSNPHFARRSSPGGRNHSSDQSYAGALSSIQSQLHMHAHLFSGVDASTSSAAAELGLIRCSSDHEPTGSHDAFICRGGKNDRFIDISTAASGNDDATAVAATSDAMIPSTTTVLTARTAVGAGGGGGILDLLKSSSSSAYHHNDSCYGSSSSLADLAAAADLLQQQLCHPSSQFNSSNNNNNNIMIMTPAGPFLYRSDSALSCSSPSPSNCCATMRSPPTKDHVFGGCTSHASEYHSPPSEYLIRNPNELLIMDGGKLLEQQQNNVSPHRFYNNLAEAEGPSMGFAATTSGVGGVDGDEEDGEAGAMMMMMTMMMGGDAAAAAMDMEAARSGEGLKAMHMMKKEGDIIDQAEMDMEEDEFEEEEEDVVNLKNSNSKKKTTKNKEEVAVAMVVGSTKGKSKGNGPPAKNLMAERRRRKKLNDRLYTLRSVVPNISKMDRASILGDAIEYLKELLQRINDLHNELETIPGAAEHQSPRQAMDGQHHHHFTSPSGNMPNVNVLPPCIKLEDCVTDLEQPSSSGVAPPMHFADRPHDPSQPPEIDVRIRDGKVLNIHMLCPRRPGLLLSTMRALDSLGLDIQQAVISCFSGFALDVFRADREQSNENDVAVEEDIKRVLLLTATSPASDV